MKKALAFLVALQATVSQAGQKAEVSREAHLRELVEVEREFAEHARATNWVDAFRLYLGEDGIMFVPGPSRARDFLAGLPPAAAESKVTWFPTYSDISVD